MKILVANLGSTSFKYRLFELDGSSERQLARGGIDRIGQPESRCVVEIADQKSEMTANVPDQCPKHWSVLAATRPRLVRVTLS